MKGTYAKYFLMGLGYMGISVIFSLYEADVPVMLEETFSLSNLATGLVINIDTFFAVAFMPIVTAYSDIVRTRTGRRLPFFLTAMPLMAFFFALSALIPMVLGSSTCSLLVFILMLILTNVFLGVAKGPFMALMCDVTEPRERSVAYGFLNFMGGLGSILVYFGIGHISSYNRFAGFAMASAVALLCALVVGSYVKEVPRVSPLVNSGSWWHEVQTVMNPKYTSLWLELFGVFLWFMAVSGIEVFYVVFVAMESGFPEAIAETLAKLNLGIMSSAFAFFAVPAGWLGARFGSKRVMILGLLLTGFAVSGIMSAGSPVTSRGYFAIAGVGMAMVGINSYPAVMDMAKPTQNGTFTAFYLFASQIAYLISAPLIGFASDLVGSRSVVFELTLVFVFLALVFMVLAKTEKIREDVQ